MLKHLAGPKHEFVFGELMSSEVPAPDELSHNFLPLWTHIQVPLHISWWVENSKGRANAPVLELFNDFLGVANTLHEFGYPRKNKLALRLQQCVEYTYIASLK